MHKTVAVSLLFPLLLAAPVLSRAGEWQTCHLQVKVVNLIKAQFPREVGNVLAVRTGSAHADCPQTGSLVNFVPEDTNQQVLSRLHWPRPGDTVSLRYQYQPADCAMYRHCRNEHYAVVTD